MNHYACGAVGDFLYRRVLGIEPMEGGYRKFRVQPLLGGGITWAKGHTQTAYGKIEVSWYIEDDQFIIHVNVPVSAECELIMPSRKTFSLLSGEHSFRELLIMN